MKTRLFFSAASAMPCAMVCTGAARVPGLVLLPVVATKMP
jgi:hypothetical protein